MRVPLHERVVLARLGGFTFVWFGAFAALGMFVGGAVAFSRMAQLGVPLGEVAPRTALAVPIAALVGSRLWALVAVEWADFRRDAWGTLARTSYAWQGGFVAVTATMMAFGLRTGVPLPAWADAFAFAVPVGQALGRVGCHTYGCCHGRPWSGRGAVVVHNPASKVVWSSHLGGVSLFPAQLTNAASNAVLAVGLALLAAAGPWPGGTIGGLYLVGDGVQRAALESVRGVPAARFHGWTWFRWVALAQVVVGLGMLAATRLSPLADFTSAPGPAFVEVAPQAGWLFACAVLAFAAFGVHRGDPGSLVRRTPAVAESERTRRSG